MSDDPAKAFLAALAGESTERVLLAGLPGELGNCIRRCAIPHHFNADILTVLSSDLGIKLDAVMDELVRLPIVNEDDSGLFIHETIRNTMFRGWLTGPDVQLFKDLNRRLVESFVLRQKQRLDESFDSFVQSIVFHTFAYDETHAIQLFGTLFQHERERQRLGSCQLAIDWAAEYGNYLGPRTRTQLNLYSGIVAGELKNFDQAINAFLLAKQGDPTSAEVQVKAALGLAQAYAELQRFDEAFAACVHAYDSARAHFASLIPDVLLAWGRILRDGGRLSEAEGRLIESARLAGDLGHNAVAAGALNALGALYRQRNDPRAAIRTLQSALGYLDATQDTRLVARAKSNIGALMCDLNEWADAEKYLLDALRTYRQLGDKSGEAATLNNLLRVNLHEARSADAISNATNASILFVELRDYYAGAVARVNLAKILRKEGKHEEWKRPLAEAISLFEQANATSEAAFHRQQLLS